MNKIYEVSKVYKTYIQRDIENHALENVSLDIFEGEFIVILGPSGSGKSTMLNLLSGIDNPTKGNVKFEGNNIGTLSDKELTEYRRDNLGFIFQSYNLISNLTIYENIELGANLSNNRLDIKKLINLVGLKDHAHKYPYQLSGGQMQRVAIARALAKNPKVLFCDEPTGALDEKTGKNVLKSLQDINKEYKTTMIVVTHNPSIAGMANRVVKMNSGKIVSIEENKEQKDALELRWA